MSSIDSTGGFAVFSRLFCAVAAVVLFMPEVSKTHMGGTMRLGRRKTILQRNSLAYKLYDEQTDIDERHRHRYEVNIDRVPDLEKVGLKFTGRDETGERMEVLELEGHPFFVGAHAHQHVLYASSPCLARSQTPLLLAAAS